MNILKRNGSEVLFDRNKIAVAISKACNEVDEKDRLPLEQILQIAFEIEKQCEHLGYEVTVEDVQDMVEKQILSTGACTLARTYMKYRQEHNLARGTGELYQRIMAIVDGESEEATQENSNKNPVIASTQRDYMAGEVSRNLTDTKLLPQDVVEAHKAGIIHFHDADYYAQHIHNCFSSTTRFVTSAGVVAFGKCRDGEEVNVLDKHGIWRKATVRKYEQQKMFDVTLRSCRTSKTIVCTRDHRWILKDGSVTTNLQVGDVLYPLSEITSNLTPQTKRDCEMFALGMCIGDGSQVRDIGTQIRLCGAKTKYADVFRRCGYRVSNMAGTDDLVAYSSRWKKREFLEAKGWAYLNDRDKQMLFAGYYAADGCADKNVCHTSNDVIAKMIEDLSALCGYHIVSKNLIIHDTNYKKDARLWQFSFIRSTPVNRCWRVDDIQPHREHDQLRQDAWCVEEPVTHSFTLEGGIVTGNCCLVNLEDMLQNGTVISGTLIEKPHSFSTACNIATQIVAQVASNQYGGQTISLAHLAPFVDVSRKRIRTEVLKEMAIVGATPSDETISDIVENRLREEVRRGVQTIQYQVVTLMTTNGQAPFITVFMYLDEVDDPQTRADLAMIIEETLKQRYQGVKNESGAWVTPAFPKLIYVLDDDNVAEDSPYWYLTVLAAKCTARRMVPDYISAKKMRELKGDVYSCMGCRSFLTPDRFTDVGIGNLSNAGDYKPGKHRYYGRFNQGVVTINLPDVGLSAHKDFNLFWQIFDERLELCHKALRLRHERLRDTPSDISPIHWQYGALARLAKGETIDKLLYNGYSTLSLGYAGLYECTVAMTGKSHTDPAGKEFALAVMQHMNDKCAEWKAAENIDYSLYGTPIESTTYKFAKCLKKRFGVIPEVTDHNYITNSYHINVREKIDAFSKLAFESEFQQLSPGGAISYVEVPDMQGNIEAVLSVMQFIYDHIMYAELNTKSVYCQVCGWDGEIPIVEDENKKLIFKCPRCGNTDRSKLNIARRTCGYIGTNDWNQGRVQEIKERVLHL